MKQIQEEQARIRKVVAVMEELWRKRVGSPEPTIGEAGALSLTKGEAKKIQHTIHWNQYKEDDLVVKVTASDSSIMVTPTMTLNFEKHQFRFEYEIKAGNKDGTFKITLTPAMGPPVEVQVTVK